jgi:endonuclease/exonuclease/phosphatase family metal-dependent hydrolase
MNAAFSLLTFNCFGGLAPTTLRRLATLGRELDQRAYDVVCLQEVQSHAARRLLIRASTGYPAAAHAPALFAPRGALLTLARAPLTQVRYTRYHIQGRWYTPTVMDVLTQKGVLATRLLHAGTPIVVLNTHLMANYGANWRPESRAVGEQRAQLLQLAELVREQPAEALVLVAGDFNIPRGGWLHAELLERAGLRDLLADDARPTYRPFPGVSLRYALALDFVLMRAPPGLQLEVEGDLCFAERLPLVGGGQGYLSDHIGVEVRLSWERRSEHS